MKTISPLWLIPAIGLGMALSWISHSSSPATGHLTGSATPTTAAATSVTKAGTSMAELTPTPDPALEAATVAVERLSPEAFGQRLAELLLQPTLTDEELKEKNALTAKLNPDRLTELYIAYMRRTGIVRDNGNDAKLMHLLIDMGKKDGTACIAKLLNRFPSGFERWDSLIHGWAYGDPAASVAWFNELPEDLPRRESALRGLIWGLADKSGPLAAEVWKNLDERDQAASAWSFANSFGWSHGLNELDAWLTNADPVLAQLAIANATDFVISRPPVEAVPWLATHSDVLGIRPQLSSGFAQWAATDPTEAYQWLATLPPELSAGPAIQHRLLQSLESTQLQVFQQSYPDISKSLRDNNEAKKP